MYFFLPFGLHAVVQLESTDLHLWETCHTSETLLLLFVLSLAFLLSMLFWLASLCLLQTSVFIGFGELVRKKEHAS